MCASFTYQNQMAIVRVSASQWAAYCDLKRKAAALDREAKQAAELMGLPDGETVARQMGLVPGAKGEIVVQDLNGSPIGKLTVFHRDSFEMPACWIRR